VGVAAAGVILLAGCGSTEAEGGYAVFASPQVDPIALSPDERELYAVNTPNGTVSVVDTARRRVVAEIDVGLEPASLAVRPDGRQLLVSNHVSDSVAVVDVDPASPHRHRVVQVVQDLDEDGVTRFDEPLGIAFASDEKAYVALSSRNQIAVLERRGERWRVKRARIQVRAQEPRAIAVRDGRLFVLAFESANQTELSNCPTGDQPPQCTFGPLRRIKAGDDAPIHIIRDPDAPDRDLFVYDTKDERELEVVSHLGTLLYGFTVDPAGRVFVAHTDARNAVNGMRGGTLADLENRIYENRVARVDCSNGGCRFDPEQDLFRLDPPPPDFPAQGRALATPYAIALSADGSTLFASAAGSHRIFSLDAQSGAVRGVLDVGHLPRGLVLQAARDDQPARAWVLNALDTTLTLVDVSDPAKLRALDTISVGDDPTPDAVIRGRIAFESARASSSGTFACGSCHPDAHMDELIWRIGGDCSKTLSPLCGSPEPRVTKPIQGLRNTIPLHWDGTLGDPYGGPNGAVGIKGDGGSDCKLGDADGDHECFVDLVRASLGAVMCDQRGECPPGGNLLSEAEQSDMAIFLASVWHGPARSRAVDDTLSESARVGFAQFFTDQGGLDRGTCADTRQGCHTLPLGVSTNGSNPVVGAFDAPGLRGLTDRYVQQSLGGNSSEEMLLFMNAPYGLEPPFDGMPPSAFPYDPEIGYDEASTFAVGFLFFQVDMGVDDATHLFQMAEEASTGSSGATGRQVLLDAATLAEREHEETRALLTQLEEAAARGVVVLAGESSAAAGDPAPVRYVPERSVYRVNGSELARDALLESARTGARRVLLTARLPQRFSPEAIQRQPLLATARPGIGPTGDPPLPVLASARRFELQGIDVEEQARIFVDGRPVPGRVRCVGGKFEPRYCSSERIEVLLEATPTEPGLRLVQVQNPQGPLSDELPVCVPPIERCKEGS
jgi:YVTN family beta-propeller protein